MRSGDAQDILDISLRQEQSPGSGAPPNSSAGKRKQKPSINVDSVRRPDGMKRELFNLLVHSGGKEERISSFAPSSTKAAGYSVVRAQLGLRRVRGWRWNTFANPGNEKLRLKHWEREGDEGKPYPFAKYNKAQSRECFTDAEYDECLNDAEWTKAETSLLLDLVHRFDMRWPVVHSKFHAETGGKRNMEDVKERYYNVLNTLNVLRGKNVPMLSYDADHERRRKEQLTKLLNRTAAELQIKEEEELKAALKRIEASKARREKTAQDVQRLILEASRHSLSPEGSIGPAGSSSSAALRQRKMMKVRTAATTADQLIDRVMKEDWDLKCRRVTKEEVPFQAADGLQIRYPDFRSVGPHLRSQEAKLPNNLGLKKLKNIDAVVQKLKLDPYPDAFPDIVEMFNTIRSNVVMLQNLKTALASSEADLESLNYKICEEAGEPITIEPRMRVNGTAPDEEGVEETGSSVVEKKEAGAPATSRHLTNLIDINPVTAVGAVAPNRKRRTRQFSPAD